MIEALVGIVYECWEILKEAAPYVLFGFFAAGLLKALIPERMIARHLGGNGFRSVLKASLFGIPLPLCSCGVIPVAIGLRKQGASRGATASFLVSVPETGVDSVAITWALLDPLMTVIRPLSAFLTALLAGSLISLLPDKATDPAGTIPPEYGCSSSAPAGPDSSPKGALVRQLKDGVVYAFTELLRDIGGWLMLGVLIAGVITYFVPADFVNRFLGGEYSSLAVMLIVGIPLYICASASTPIAAALVLKGLSPGAALVFLLAGPATNAVTITVVAKQLGKAAAVVYVAAVAVASLVLGWVANRIYAWLAIDALDWVHRAGHGNESLLYPLSAIVLVAILLWNFRPRRKAGDSGCGSQPPQGGG